jgi:hypothetical protein
MIKAIIDNLKSIMLISAVIAGLGVLGAFINSYIPWIYLTYTFGIMRKLVSMLDFLVDTNTLFALFGVWLGIFGALWTFKGIMFVIKWFKKDH